MNENQKNNILPLKKPPFSIMSSSTPRNSYRSNGSGYESEPENASLQSQTPGFSNRELEYGRMFVQKNQRAKSFVFKPPFDVLFDGKTNKIKVTEKFMLEINSVIPGLESTPLQYACEFGHLGAAEILIAEGASLNLMDETGHTPLSLAMRSAHNKNDFAKLLIENGADPDSGFTNSQYETKVPTKDFSYKHPLSELIESFEFQESNASDIQALKTLLEAGADPNVQNKQGVSVLETAVMQNNVEVATILLENGAKITEKTRDLINKSNNAAVKDLVEEFSPTTGYSKHPTTGPFKKYISGVNLPINSSEQNSNQESSQKNPDSEKTPGYLSGIITRLKNTSESNAQTR